MKHGTLTDSLASLYLHLIPEDLIHNFFTCYLQKKNEMKV